VEGIQNHLGRALAPQEGEWRGNKRPRVLRGTQPSIYIPSNPKDRYVQARGRTCPVQTALAVSEELENH
jgi:hypothetical protein